MTSKQKQVIRDMRQRGLTYSMIAESLGLSINTVKSFCYRDKTEVRNYAVGTNKNLCKNCKKPLIQLKGAKPKTFCSDKCRYMWWNRNRDWAGRKALYHMTCQSCGNVFESYGNKKRKYCGRDCYTRSRYGEGLP